MALMSVDMELNGTRDGKEKFPSKEKFNESDTRFNLLKVIISGSRYYKNYVHFHNRYVRYANKMIRIHVFDKKNTN